MNGDEEQLVQAPYQPLIVGPITSSITSSITSLCWCKRGCLMAEGQADTDARQSLLIEQSKLLTPKASLGGDD